MTTIQEITAKIFADIPPQTRFGKQDAECIANHREALLELEDAIIQGFYDVLYSHPQTLEILKSGDRTHRENILRFWWRQTLHSQFDEQYWQWQVFIGLVHIKQKVTNPMLISMWGWILNTVNSELRYRLPAKEQYAVMNAFGRLAATIQALTAESVMVNTLQAVAHATGISTESLDRFVGLQIDDMIKQSKPDA